MSTKEARDCIGDVNYDLKGDESSMIKFRRSLYAVKDIKVGDKFTKNNIRRIRPGFGIEPKYFDKVLGKTAKVDIQYGTALNWDLINE